MESRCYDFVESLGHDASASVFACIDDFADLIRASAVSRNWRRFVIENGLCKKLVLKLYPESSIFSKVIEVNDSIEPVEVVHSDSSEWETLSKEHRVYVFLSKYLNSCTSTSNRNLILHAIAASSTDNYPDETIEHTLEPSSKINHRPSYWSSKGAKDPQVPETLTYNLSSNLSIINEINISPFQAYFQFGCPIYSSQAIRFRVGYSARLQEASNADEPTISQKASQDNYIWTYVSPTFPMAQENKLQSFKLPRPVLGTGGILQIEFLGRVQRQEMDDLYYICICYVQVLGRPSPSALNLTYLDNSGQLALECRPHAWNIMSNEEFENHQIGSSDVDHAGASGWHAFPERLRLRRTMGWNEMILGTLLGAGLSDDDSEDDDADLFIKGTNTFDIKALIDWTAWRRIHCYLPDLLLHNSSKTRDFRWSLCPIVSFCPDLAQLRNSNGLGSVFIYSHKQMYLSIHMTFGTFS